MKHILVAVLVCVTCLSCRGQESIDGNYLLAKCPSAVKSFDHEKLDVAEGVNAAYCIGYVSGVLDMDALWLGFDKKAANKNLSMHICSPGGEGVAIGQAVRVVVKWLKDNPEKLHWRGETVVVLALRQAFPCP